MVYHTRGYEFYTVYLNSPFITPIRPLLLDYIMQSKPSFLRQLPEHFLEDLLAIVQVHQPQTLVV